MFITRRGELDTVIMRPERLLALIESRAGDLAQVLRERLFAAPPVVITERMAALMKVLKKHPDSRLMDIASKLDQAAGNIHSRLGGLVRRGLVLRQDLEDDEHIVYRLTGVGEKALEGIKK
jgi:DNA-binding MarR family transcriptional regulator